MIADKPQCGADVAAYALGALEPAEAEVSRATSTPARCAARSSPPFSRWSTCCR